MDRNKKGGKARYRFAKNQRNVHALPEHEECFVLTKNHENNAEGVC